MSALGQAHVAMATSVFLVIVLFIPIQLINHNCHLFRIPLSIPRFYVLIAIYLLNIVPVQFLFAFADRRASRAIGNPTNKACPIISVRKIGRRFGPGLLLIAESGTTT